MRMYYLKELTFPAMKQRPKESWKPLLNTIPAFKGSAECSAGRKFLKIIYRWHHNCFYFAYISHNLKLSQCLFIYNRASVGGRHRLGIPL